MKPPIALAAMTLLTAALTGGVATANHNASVHLLVHANDTFPFDEPAFTRECILSVPPGTSGVGLLNQAIGQGCIQSWDSVNFDCCGKFVTSIRGPLESSATDGRNTFTVSFGCTDPDAPRLWSFWAFLVNGAPSNVGVDYYHTTPGDVVEFYYLVDDCNFTKTSVFFTGGGAHVHSPVALEGHAATDPGA